MLHPRRREVNGLRAARTVVAPPDAGGAGLRATPAGPMLAAMTAEQPGRARPARVGVAVLGDLGRSPRMLYHALALAEAGAEVHLVGEEGSGLPAAVGTSPAIAVRLLRAPGLAGRRRGVAGPALRVVQRGLRLCAALRRLPRLDTLLVQVPPPFPTLAVARTHCRARGTRLVVDWHNLAAPLAALRLGARHPAVAWLAAHERRQGSRADAHLCVSAALGSELARRGLRATVFPDRPAARFRPADPAAAAELASRPPGLVPAARDGARRPALVVCPCGYTEDEDLDLLLAAALAYERRSAGRSDLPALRLLVTGDGPRRRDFERRAAALVLDRVTLGTAWLEADDYPLALGAADLGLSLHRSASGLDLPMKVADLLGSGVPVCALAYPCLAEQVRDGVDAALFADAEGLASALERVLRGFPDAAVLASLRDGALAARRPSWGELWEGRCREVLLPESPHLS